MSNTENKTHHGRNLKRFREILGIKQETIAYGLGDTWDQKKVSRLEEKPVIEDELMEQIAAILKVSPEQIKNFDEERAINIFSNTYHDNSSILGTYHFNPIDKLVEIYEENKKLYEALLKEKDEKNFLLEKLLKEKK